MLRYHQQKDDKESLAATLGTLGDLARQEGDYDAAASLLTQSLALWRKLEYDHPLSIQLNNLARVATRRGEFASARAYVREAISLRQKLGDVKGLLWSLDAAAGLASAEGRLREAARLYAAVEALERAQSIAPSPSELAGRAHFLDPVRAGLSGAEFGAAWAQGQSLTLEEAVAAVLHGSE